MQGSQDQATSIMREAPQTETINILTEHSLYILCLRQNIQFHFFKALTLWLNNNFIIHQEPFIYYEVGAAEKGVANKTPLVESTRRKNPLKQGHQKITSIKGVGLKYTQIYSSVVPALPHLIINEQPLITPILIDKPVVKLLQNSLQ